MAERAVLGLVHAVNGLAGVPLAFVAIQTLNAMVWGVMYGYARSKTESIFPPMLLHAGYQSRRRAVLIKHRRMNVELHAVSFHDTSAGLYHHQPAPAGIGGPRA